MRRLLLVALLAGGWASGCASAYDDTYEAESRRLRNEQEAALEQERAAHAEAKRYAAVIYFDVGSAVIKEEGFRELNWFVEKLRPYPKAVIEVQGFADSTGGDAINQRLSYERAENVSRYLASRGIPQSQLVPIGLAAEFAADDNATPEGRRKNRRVEVSVR